MQALYGTYSGMVKDRRAMDATLFDQALPRLDVALDVAETGCSWQSALEQVRLTRVHVTLLQYTTQRRL